MDCSITCFWMSWNSMWKRVEGEGSGANKTNTLCNTISNSGKMFLSVCLCSDTESECCSFQFFSWCHFDDYLFSMHVFHRHHIHLFSFAICGKFLKKLEKNTTNETYCLKNNNATSLKYYIKHVLTDFFPFLSFFPFLTVFSVERKLIWNFTETQLGITDVGNSMYRARIVTSIA